MAEFELQVRHFGKKLFAETEKVILTEKEQELFAYICNSGTYVTMKNRVVRKLSQLQGDETPIRTRTKWNYYRERLFPPMEWFQA
ncbi:MAG: hypothetical protein PHE06_12400, partial [Lachnospiraceae bacterium]|nr:hypothetical protein [Lachnospiraceae bacterium]